MSIPDIDLRFSAFGVSLDPFGTNPSIGSVSDSVTKWSLDPAYTAIVYDIYEGGSPMTDGRTFQVPCLTPSVSGIAVAEYGPFYGVIPSRINIPVVFLLNTPSGDPIQTVFHIDSGGGLTAGFFNGAFFRGGVLAGNPFFDNCGGAGSGGDAHLGSAYVPVVLEPAETVGPFVGIDSASYQWYLGSPSISGALPVPIYEYLPRGYPGSTQSEDRRAIVNYVGVGTTDAFGRSIASGSVTDIASGKMLRGPFYNNTFAQLRAYRRASTHATYDWPGLYL